MTASKHDMMDRFAKSIGRTDLARVDAHVIQPHEYDEIPELTDEMIARSVPGSDPRRLQSAGRPPSASPKRQVTIRLDQDLLDGLRATGPGWQTRINEAVREWLQRRAA